MLIVKGERKAEAEKIFVYQGIAERDFERKFQLADYVKVVGASMEMVFSHRPRTRNSRSDAAT